MPRSLNCFENLVDLNLSDNILTDIPLEIAKLKGLEKLDFSRQGKGDLLQVINYVDTYPIFGPHLREFTPIQSGDHITPADVTYYRHHLQNH